MHLLTLLHYLPPPPPYPSPVLLCLLVVFQFFTCLSHISSVVLLTSFHFHSLRIDFLPLAFPPHTTCLDNTKHTTAKPQPPPEATQKTYKNSASKTAAQRKQSKPATESITKLQQTKTHTKLQHQFHHEHRQQLLYCTMAQPPPQPITTPPPSSKTPTPPLTTTGQKQQPLSYLWVELLPLLLLPLLIVMEEVRTRALPSPHPSHTQH